MGRIANKHLAKLWDFMANYNLKSAGASAGDIVIDVFEKIQECDEALSELDDQCEHWKIMYANACGDQDVLKESIRLLDTENRRLMAENKDLKKEIEQRRKEADGLYKALDRLREENEAGKHVIDDFIEKINGKDEDIEKLDHMLQDLQREYDKLKNDRDRKAEAVVELAKKRDELQEEYNKLLNNSRYFRNSRDTWRSRAKHSEAEAVELAKKHDKLQEENEDLKNDRYSWIIRAERAEGKAEVLTKKLAEANDILEETNRDRNEWRRRALMTKLTSKVPDIKEEYEITFTMDKADHKEIMNLLSSKAFGASPEYMRDSLKEFCEDHDSCRLCPLKECGSDLGIDFDSMSDEEIEKLYKIVIRCNT